MRMQWRTRTLNVDSAIPARLVNHHFDPDVGDRISAWRHIPAGDAVDGNITPGAGHLWFLHWPTPGPNGYTRVVDEHTGHVRNMTPAERHRSIDAWGYQGVKRWRDKHGQAPLTHLEGITWLAEHHIVCAQEAKGPAWATSPEWFTRLYANCKRAGHPAWVKRLVQLRFPLQTVKRAHDAHVQIAAIYGKGLRGRVARLAHTHTVERGWKGLRFDATW